MAKREDYRTELTGREKANVKWGQRLLGPDPLGDSGRKPIDRSTKRR